MHMRHFILILCSLLTVSASGQQSVTNMINLDGGVASRRGSLSLSFLHNWRLGENKRFGIGLGARFNSFFGSDLYYITAPAKLTSGETGPQVIFIENIEENIDSLLINLTQVNSFNLMINLDYRFTGKLAAGFNIDLVGGSFGARQQANFMSGSMGSNTTATPSPFNLLLISDNDMGSLNSELFVKYWWRDDWAAKVSAQFLFTEYTTETKVQQYPEENDRFRNKSLMFSIGVSRKL